MFVHGMYDGRLPHGGRHAAIKSIERRCGPAATWAGRCQEIASAFIVDDLVEGALTVGMWTGAVASGVPTTPGPGGVVHGWITREDGSVVDPTRFVFEGRAPYVYIGKADRYVAMGAVVPRE